ncbi:hypothetical protein H5410_048975 [Solanum commersonii]|uniref:F-box associated domain-containing protein n=1 Tax=Solanum commersonii TaxID=4109 RepID=A0A9J5XL35_SOLCO|nr:hypothetical protein H5410_048975 [Solanum commersonii]
MLLQIVDTNAFKFIHLENPQVVIEWQLSPRTKNSQVLCSYDGLLLLVTHNKKTLECSYLDNSTCPCASGLCYDSATDDYKVILIYKSFYVVCSMNRNIWRKKTTLSILEQSIISSCSGSKFCSKGINNEDCLDEFKELPPLNFVGKSSDHLYRLSTLKGHLILYGGKNFDLKSDIWMMEQDGSKWSKLCNIISASCDDYVRHCYKLLCWTKNDELIFYEPLDHVFYIYDIKQKQLVKKIVSNYRKNMYSFADKHFKKAYRDHSKILGREKMLLQKVDTNELEFIHLENNQVIIESQRSPMMNNSQVLCSYDGLLLLVTRMAYKTFSTCPCTSGLCYDSATDDYKVILIYTSFYVVCSTNRNFWRKKTTLSLLEQSILSSCSRSDFCNTGISIEGCSDEFKELPTSDFIVKSSESYRLSTLKGHLILYGGKNFVFKLDIWIKEQDGSKWSKFCNIALPCCDYYLRHCYKLLWCTKNGEIILHKAWHHELYIYNPKQKQLVKTTKCNYYSNNMYSLVNYTYLDTLCFPRL